MMLTIQRINALLVLIFLLAACSVVQGCDNRGKGAIIPMKTYYIGRFSIAVPAEMRLEDRDSILRYVEIKEISWEKSVSHEDARETEWTSMMKEVESLSVPEGKDKIIIKRKSFSSIGKWGNGIFYYSRNDGKVGKWLLLIDLGKIGVLLKTLPVIVEKENISNKSLRNIENIGNAYKLLDTAESIGQQNNYYYLEKGVLCLPYSAQEESYARFEGHTLDLVIDIKMEMDVGYYRETVGLIEKTKEMLTAATMLSGGGISKIRLNKRKVAGMQGEESILRIVDGNEKSLHFTWEFNGKEDSGEYPTTTIEMEAPDGNLDEKARIWDAVLDSVKPMFERKK